MVMDFGKEHVVDFTGPLYIDDENLPQDGGLYAVLVGDSDKKQFKPLFFGQTDNLNSFRLRDHPLFKRFIHFAENERFLFLGMHEMPNTNEEQRAKVLDGLVEEVRPPLSEGDIPEESPDSPEGYRFFKTAPDDDIEPLPEKDY